MHTPIVWFGPNKYIGANDTVEKRDLYIDNIVFLADVWNNAAEAYIDEIEKLLCELHKLKSIEYLGKKEA